MRKNRRIWSGFCAAAAAVLLSGCVMTVDQMYCIPRRSREFDDLQAVMDAEMEGLSYCAPTSGENQQPVQMADLDGDGAEEILVFARGQTEKPLQILIFARQDDSYALKSRVESAGTAFDRVDYIQMDGKMGLEMAVGRQVHDQVLRNLSVYDCSGGKPEPMMAVNYRNYLACDLNQDGLDDLAVLNTGRTDAENGTVCVYSVAGGAVQKSTEAQLSRPVDQLKRLMTGGLSSGEMAVFAASSVDENTIVTDVFALDGEILTNVALANDSGTGVNTLRNYWVYADDIDHDGVLELPELITMSPPEGKQQGPQEHMIRWYAMDRQGRESLRMYTYHNYMEGWYMELDPEFAYRLCVTREGIGCCSFGLWNEDRSHMENLWTLYVLSGEERSAQAEEGQRFVLMKTETAVYAAELAPEALSRGIRPEHLADAFHLIETDWNTGEM